MILSSKSLLNRAIEPPTVNPIEQYLANYANPRRPSMRTHLSKDKLTNDGRRRNSLGKSVSG
jgi:hypothetical protein